MKLKIMYSLFAKALNHKVMHILLVFFLTYVVGGSVTSSYQKKQIMYQHTLVSNATHIESSIKAFDRLSQIMDARLYAYRQILWALNPNSGSLENLGRKISNYSSVLKEWNENLNSNLSYIEVYFGQESRNIFEEDIMPHFISLGILVNDAKYDFPNVENREEIKSSIESLNAKVYDFDVLMLKSIKTSKYKY